MAKGKSGWESIPDDKKKKYSDTRKLRTRRVVLDRLVPGIVQMLNRMGPVKWFESLTSTQQYNLVMRAMELQTNAGGVTAAGDAPHVLQQVGHFQAGLVQSEQLQMKQFESIDPPVVGSEGYNPAHASVLSTGDSEVPKDHQLPKSDYDQVEPMPEEEDGGDAVKV